MTYDVGNPDPALGQAQKCGGGKQTSFIVVTEAIIFEVSIFT